MGASTTTSGSLPSPVSTFYADDTAADATVQTLKGSATDVPLFSFDNSNGSDCVLCIWNNAAPTPGTDYPNFHWPIPAGKADVILIRDVKNAIGAYFGTAATWAVLNDAHSASGPTVNKPHVTIYYN